MSLMRCPACGADDNIVIDVRPSASRDYLRRRRKCTKCGERYTTMEVQAEIIQKASRLAKETHAVRQAMTEMLKTPPIPRIPKVRAGA